MTASPSFFLSFITLSISYLHYFHQFTPIFHSSISYGLPKVGGFPEGIICTLRSSKIDFKHTHRLYYRTGWLWLFQVRHDLSDNRLRFQAYTLQGYGVLHAILEDFSCLWA